MAEQAALFPCGVAMISMQLALAFWLSADGAARLWLRVWWRSWGGFCEYPPNVETFRSPAFYFPVECMEGCFVQDAEQ
jgi:hypothetical protein